MFNELKKAMGSNGIHCPIDIIADGKTHRFSSNGERDKNGWFVLFENSDDSYGGSYGDWKMGKSYKWSSFKGIASPQQKQELKTHIEAHPYHYLKEPQ